MRLLPRDYFTSLKGRSLRGTSKHEHITRILRILYKLGGRGLVGSLPRNHFVR